MLRVAITGATGFVGANLARRLVHEGHAVHLLLRPGYATWRIESLRPHLQLHEVALQDLADVTRVVRRIRPEWVFHLAAHGAYARQTDLDQMVATNIHGTVNLVRACLLTGFDAFVNTGSSSEYGLKDHAPAETEAIDPNSHYAVTKASGTLFCRYSACQEKVHLPTLRLYSVYGPYEEPTRLIPTVIVRGLRGEWPPLVHPDTARDFVYVEDVVDAYLLAAARRGPEWGAVYNVGTGICTTLRDVIRVAQDALPVAAEPQWSSMPARQWDTHCWVSDSRRIRDALGWRPRFAFADGFRATRDWLRDPANPLSTYGLS